MSGLIIAIVIAALAVAPLLLLLAFRAVRRPPPARPIDGQHVEELVRARLYGAGTLEGRAAVTIANRLRSTPPG